MTYSDIPPVAFLGVAERCASVRDGNTNLFKQNILGLKQTILSHIFPLNLGSFHWVLALYTPQSGTEMKLRIKDESDVEVGVMHFSLESLKTDEPTIEDVLIKREGQTWQIPVEGWVFLTTPIHRRTVIIPNPGLYNVVANLKDKEAVVGQLVFCLIDPEPLSLSRIAAIRSNPTATKAIRVEIQCNSCGESIKAYAGLERLPKSEAAGYIWFADLPDFFKCSCGQQNYDLRIYRRNLQGLLGRTPTSTGEVSLTPLYEKGALTTVYKNFTELLGRDAKEEIYQIFLEENLVLLHQFSPVRIFSKAPILSKYKTDFVILTPRQELLLIELERPDTKILKQDGDTHSELQHACDQVSKWIHEMNEHRPAVLNCIGLDLKEVGAIQGIVIAGRNSGYDAEHLRRLKANDRGPIKVMTYDDLLIGLGNLIATFEKL